MCYYVVYEDYRDFTQNEGAWVLEIQSFETLKAAREWIRKGEENANISNVIGSLKKVKRNRS
ncbi:MAG: hypothetical protein Q8R07_05635 [Candidatus Uhrbacteria bacterium]|nr:hypothetical protein [Candidatus Uhrbacteria bacterium]